MAKKPRKGTILACVLHRSHFDWYHRYWFPGIPLEYIRFTVQCTAWYCTSYCTGIYNLIIILVKFYTSLCLHKSVRSVLY